MKKLITFVSLALFAFEANARNNVSIAGSSTVLPFATIIAEQAGKKPGKTTPVVESGGSSVGKKGVCEGTGFQYIDIGNASSRMKLKELKYCEKNNVKLTEIKVGYDGIVVANSKKGTQLNISKADLAKALTAKIPACVANKSNVNCDKFVEMVNQKGYCGKDKIAKAASKARGDKKGKKCRAMRTDGAYIEAGEQDNLIVQKLQADPTTYGIFGFSYLDQNSDVLEGAVIDGGKPTFENISNGKYSISRALYFYIKHSHVDVVPGVKDYIQEWTNHWGDDGLLADAGMIPMSQQERNTMMIRMKNLTLLKSEHLKK